MTRRDPTMSPRPRRNADRTTRAAGAAPRHRQGRRRRHGMTFVELCCGMVVTAMVLGALSALWFAVGEVWRSSSTSQAVASTGNQASLRLESAFRQARFVIKSESGSLDNSTTPAWAFVWRGDFWNRPAQTATPADYATPVADGAVQLAELGLLQFDPASGKVYFYRAKDAALMTEAQRRAASEVPTFATLQKSETRDSFKTLAFVDRTVVAQGVTGLRIDFPKTQPGSRPIVEFTMNVARNGMNSAVYGTAVMRSPSTQPSY